MIRVLIGDLFESEAQTLVNTINCVGIMGKGIALQFKNRFPDMFKDYAARCKLKKVALGRPYLYKPLFGKWVLNFPTKDHWRSVATLKDIVAGLEYLLTHYQEWGITSIAIPPLGCGEGQLEWRVVGPTMYRYLAKMDADVFLYAPYGTPHQELQPEFLESRPEKVGQTRSMPSPKHIQPGWMALVEILSRIERQPYHWPVGRTIFQKIAYVATEQGLPTGLKYNRGSYGPFSTELKQVTTRLVNNGLIQERRLGKMFAIETGKTYADARKAYADSLAKWDQSINKVVDLFMRMNTDQAEVTATVLFAASALGPAEDKTPAVDKEAKPTELDVLHEVMKWKQRRRPPLEEQEVAKTVRNLAALGWLKVKASRDLPLPQEAF
jgi:O-acetyl-ADP-ribose deacetylase (regulator of RNase III)/uncharacterized protein YwgA